VHRSNTGLFMIKCMPKVCQHFNAVDHTQQNSRLTVNLQQADTRPLYVAAKVSKYESYLSCEFSSQDVL